MDDRFKRTRLLIGDEGLARLARARVLVVGLGAVGSFATEALARSGVGHLRVVDSDLITESNCNRQLYALTSTLGRSKAEAARERILDINPACEVDARTVFANAASLPELLAKPLDIVVDAIDSLNSKVDLMAAALNAGIPIYSSMGAARRRDPSLIKVADISKTRVCPLARSVRSRLHRRGIESGVTCVYSTEPAPEDSFAQPEAADIPEQGRARVIMGSLPTITGIFGLTLANAVIDHLLT
ncbi:MAG: tRNA threonylcarbamoyladenosine dehydratase [Opitutales bacterium]|jgi:tRNA A37 threonylcarbamoyladenosine dehydratase